jgi:hypothetical protein
MPIITTTEACVIYRGVIMDTQTGLHRRSQDYHGNPDDALLDAITMRAQEEQTRRAPRAPEARHTTNRLTDSQTIVQA